MYFSDLNPQKDAVYQCLDVQQLPRGNIQYHIPDTFAQKNTNNRKTIMSGPHSGPPSDMHLSWNYHNKAIYSLWNHFVDVCLENHQQPEGVSGGTGGGGGGGRIFPVQNGGTVYEQNSGTVTWWQSHGFQEGMGLGPGPGFGYDIHDNGYGFGGNCGFDGSYGYGCGGYDGGYDGGYIHYENERMCDEERFYEGNERVFRTSLLYSRTTVQNSGTVYDQNTGTVYEQNTGTVSSVINTSVSPGTSSPAVIYRNRHIREAWRLPMFVQLGG